MIQVLIIDNPFEPLRNMTRTTANEGQTIREWLCGYFGADFNEFDRPTVCQHNGALLMRADWETVILQDGDLVAFVSVPQGPVVMIVLAVIALVVAVGLYLLMPDPKIPGETSASDSVYTLRGQTNRFRPNEPVEVVYGKVRHWPTYACRPYSEYVGNLQYQRSLFCLGQGQYDIASMQLDDTPTASFADVEIEVIPPGGTLTLVEAAVFTSLEVSNIELLGPDQAGFAVSGPFVINSYANPVHRLAIDITFPSGLYDTDKESGHLKSMSVELLFEYQQVNEAGAGVGVWATLFHPTITRKDNTPQRLTYSATVPEGRYQIRGRRVTNKGTSTRKSTLVRWEAAKGYAKFSGDFGNVTMVAMKALATNSLNDQTSKSFNVYATRKLPTWTPGGGWGPAVATRNPVWSVCDLFRASYGAKLPDNFLDMPTLYQLALTFEARNDWFDWVFDGSVAVWEAAQMILRVGRTSPIPQGSLITAVRDVPQTLPAAIFNQNNIVKGSLTKKLAMFTFQPFDGLVVEYTDPDTWKTKEVRCILPGRAGANMDRLKMPGCTDPQRAYREGMVIQARRELQRKTVTFQTGLEGHIPAYMDLVAIAHDTLRVGQGGMIVAFDPITREATLSEQVTFAGGGVQHKFAIRGADGAIMGNPIDCAPGTAANKVILATDPDTDLDFSENQTPPLYAFGVADVWAFLGKVSSIRPGEDSSTVELSVVNYTPEIYAYEDATTAVPAPPPPVTIKDIANPLVSYITITAVPDKADRVFVDWSPTPGAGSYMLQTSYDDGATWNLAGIDHAPPYSLGANKGTLRVRVAPISLKGLGAWTVSDAFVLGSNIDPPVAPPLAATQPPFTGLTATVNWQTGTGAASYSVDVCLPGGATVLRNIQADGNLTASYAFSDYTADGGTGRALEFHVKAVNEGGPGTPAVYTQTNPVPVAPTAVTGGTLSGGNYPVTWTHTPEADFKEYRVFASTTPGFTPGSGNLVATRSVQNASVAGLSATQFIRVAALDVWGPDLALAPEVILPSTAIPNANLALWLTDIGTDPSVWQDVSGNGRHFTQATTAKQPAIIAGGLNGLQVRRFNGTSSGLVSASGFALVSGVEFFIVCKTTTPSATGSFMNSNGGLASFGQTGTKNFVFRGTLLNTGSPAPTTAACVYTLTTVSGSDTLRKNGTSIVTGNAGSATFTAPLSVGWSPAAGGEYFPGDIAEIIVYSAANTSTNRAAIEAYLVAKWAL